DLLIGEWIAFTAWRSIGRFHTHVGAQISRRTPQVRKGFALNAVAQKLTKALGSDLPRPTTRLPLTDALIEKIIRPT
ncbi:MAG: hypothetical protein ACKO69_03455, partial [Limnohabitans sp.]